MSPIGTLPHSWRGTNLVADGVTADNLRHRRGMARQRMTHSGHSTDVSRNYDVH
jgi:hypothetical protein